MSPWIWRYRNSFYYYYYYCYFLYDDKVFADFSVYYECQLN